jgi:CubicO group peptidase (beta-lactamase class C family)
MSWSNPRSLVPAFFVALVALGPPSLPTAFNKALGQPWRTRLHHTLSNPDHAWGPPGARALPNAWDLVSAGSREQAPASHVEQKADAIFAKWNSATPGCAVGVSSGGEVVLQKAYGMADLEHDAPNASDTIFEAGSVSKQFTAAAVLLLAHDGKLSLDDPARKYLPELPDYGRPLTIRHLLTHTSGLRDWGDVESIAGWPRTTRAYTHAHVLDIVCRQRALNFPPGTNWSYSNTGYNLATIIVSRVSGKPFAEFCRERLFQPLGMAHTSWRDDFRRVVRNRAIAYADAGKDGYRQMMPFESVYGNGGLLTTIGDLLKWNGNFSVPVVGDQDFLREEQQPATLADGTRTDYALGLYVSAYKGIRQVAHSGSTAGYRAYLARYPDLGLSVAVLCNVSSGTAEVYAHAVADLYLGPALRPPPARTVGSQRDPAGIETMKTRAGMYRDTLTGTALTIVADSEWLRVEGAPLPAGMLVGTSASSFTSFNGDRTYEFGPSGRLSVRMPNGTVQRYERVEPARPTAQELAALAGTYSSDEAEVTLNVVVMEDGRLEVTRRPDTRLTLMPLYADAFTAPGLGLVRFRRDARGNVTGLSVTTGRVWDLRFARTARPDIDQTNDTAFSSGSWALGRARPRADQAPEPEAQIPEPTRERPWARRWPRSPAARSRRARTSGPASRSPAARTSRARSAS